MSRWSAPFWRGVDLDQRNSLATVQRSIDHLLCVAGLAGSSQLAFGRVISDYATFANLVDMFVLVEHRRQGFSKAIGAAAGSLQCR